MSIGDRKGQAGDAVGSRERLTFTIEVDDFREPTIRLILLPSSII